MSRAVLGDTCSMTSSMANMKAGSVLGRMGTHSAEQAPVGDRWGSTCTRLIPRIRASAWRRTPQGQVLANDAEVTAYLLESGVAVPNGAGYGLSPYFRISFATSIAILEEACRRIDAAGRALD